MKHLLSMYNVMWSFVVFSGSVLLCCNLVLKELSCVQWLNSKELAFTWLSRCCYGREARQRRKNPLSLLLSHTALLTLFSLASAFSISLPESLAGWKSQKTNESTQLSRLFIFQIAFTLSFTSALWNITLSPPFISTSPYFSVISESGVATHAPTAQGQAECATAWDLKIPVATQSLLRSFPVKITKEPFNDHISFHEDNFRHFRKIPGTYYTNITTNKKGKWLNIATKSCSL